MVLPSAAAASFNTTSAPPTTHAPIAARPSAVLAVEATAWAAPPTAVLTAPPTFPVTSCFPAVSSRPPFEMPSHPAAAAPFTAPAAPHTGLSRLSADAGAGAGTHERGDGRETDQSDAHRSPGGGHFAVVPRCWKKLTSPGPDPMTSAEAAEITAAMRPRAA